MFWLGLLLGSVGAFALAGVIVALRANNGGRAGADGLAPPSERLAEIGAMTGGLAHEIRNPLSTIGLNAQLLDEAISDLEIDSADAERISKRVSTLRREVDRLSGILEDFLRYAGELKLSRTETDLRDVVTEIADFFLPQAATANAKIVTELSDAPVLAEVDRSYLKQALLNLLLNATHALEKSPPVSAPAQITISVSSEAHGRVRCTVRDNGPGMSAEQLDRIFAPYFTTRPGGAGLGLPITKRIVEAHDGSINVASMPGRGATFTIELPVNADSPSGA